MHPANIVKSIQAKTGLTLQEVGALLHITGPAISRWSTTANPRLFPRNKKALHNLYIQLVIESKDLTPQQQEALASPTTWVTRSRSPRPTSAHVTPRFTLAYSLLLLTAVMATLLISL